MASALAERPVVDLAQDASHIRGALSGVQPVRRDVVPSGPVLPPTQPPTDEGDYQPDGENPNTIKQKIIEVIIGLEIISGAIATGATANLIYQTLFHSGVLH